jgi:hypothetical protein
MIQQVCGDGDKIPIISCKALHQRQIQRSSARRRGPGNPSRLGQNRGLADYWIPALASLGRNDSRERRRYIDASCRPRRMTMNDPADRTVFVLDVERWDAFMAALDNPPKDNPGLRRLLARKPMWEEQACSPDER